MNERIKQLAIQAGAEHFIGENAHLPIGRLDKEGIEKFAELIVQKCADIGQQYADGNYEVPNQILEYFGMQEPEE